MSTNGTHHYSTKSCTDVSALCPVSATVLGYYPNLGVNAFLAACFALCLIGLLGVGVWKKTWGYSAALVAGCILELAGVYTFFFFLLLFESIFFSALVPIDVEWTGRFVFLATTQEPN